MPTIESLDFDRALVIQSHWCNLILQNIKPWEMRSTKTKVRGAIGLIESGSGLIVGKVNLVDSLDALPESEYFNHIKKHQIESREISVSKWKFPWVLEDALRFPKPIQYSHPKGAVIWVRLTNEILKG